ncbi:RNase III [Paramecium bursaria Chlorella virus NY2B]|uniref:RNase III n=1 Tax=Paramecium bursaria Chlorella virus NYs1 TaxID=83442 RepID=M1IJY7_9PHYC|nr:RNase III [Paramecium bursaria Chlorella virus NYs1]AGE54324.1 RNase III [Paramecium bursaria Chlorella virus IL-5-2s1]AGE55010.1 RNase III [Paramecium bursaria Chlorella virus MA1D]AGE58442.1 RNase III [Paramecium bursaria Chlorella virus NY2B]AGE58825.1 RNase III [Paramecium bursaria Chlorella virus NYs1]
MEHESSARTMMVSERFEEPIQIPNTDDNFPEGPPSTKSGVMFTKNDIEYLIGMPIIDFEYYKTAFSYNAIVEGESTYERMEFVGDSVLGFIIARYLYDNFPGKDEGFLSRLRTKFVSGKFLSSIALRMGLHNFVIMHQKGLYRGWNTNPRILEDVFEALMGAIYFDLGINAAKQFFMSTLVKYADIHNLMIDTNYKDRLLKHTRKIELQRPEFVSVFEKGGANPSFVVDVVINGQKISTGTGKSRKDAEQNASKLALYSMGIGEEFIS